MQTAVHSNIGASAGRAGFALAIDTHSIVTEVLDIREAQALPGGCVAGDLQGGLTFSDAVAAALEARSSGGWQEMAAANGDIWTIIVLDR
jgi:hypothetical protein